MAESEHSEQVRLINWVRRRQLKDPRLNLLFAVPNGGNRNIATARKLKAEGVLAGVPDICLPLPAGEWHGLFIEMKRFKGGQVSLKQKIYIEQLRSHGYRCEVCNGHESAISVLEDYLNG